MSRFFVGQRVRVVSARQGENKCLIGEVAVIGAAATNCLGDVVYGLDISPIEPVLWRGVNTIRGWYAHQLEPIQPDGARPSDFKTLHDLLNSLEGVRA